MILSGVVVAVVDDQERFDGIKEDGKPCEGRAAVSDAGVDREAVEGVEEFLLNIHGSIPTFAFCEGLRDRLKITDCFAGEAIAAHPARWARRSARIRRACSPV